MRAEVEDTSGLGFAQRADGGSVGILPVRAPWAREVYLLRPRMPRWRAHLFADSLAENNGVVRHAPLNGVFLIASGIIRLNVEHAQWSIRLHAWNEANA